MFRIYSILLFSVISILIIVPGEISAQEKGKKKKSRKKKLEIQVDSATTLEKDTIVLEIDTIQQITNDTSIIATAESVSEQIEKETLNYVDECNRIVYPSIKTVLFHREGWEMSPPLLKLNKQEKLKLSFDDLDGDIKEYMYTIIHCDANWKPSELRKDEYIDGYFDDYLYDYSFSLNTIQPYTHYELIFPSTDLLPKISGNYILKVFVDNKDSVFFTRRFMVVDPKVEIEGNVKQATMIKDRNYKQEIDFSFNTAGYRIVNAYKDLKVIVIQNGRWDNALKDLKPKMIVGNEFDYNYDFENIFDGGNEFRSFDIKSLNYNTEYVIQIDKSYDRIDVYLRELERRTFKVYKTEDDINGQMVIKTEDFSVTETEAEYVNVHFFLPYPAPMLDAEMYIIGQLTDWRYSVDSEMIYDYKRKGYTKTMLLKQGYYNYHYVLKYNNQSVGDVSFIEGNHWETENTYTILIYNRELGENYDGLIGVKHISSVNE